DVHARKCEPVAHTCFRRRFFGIGKNRFIEFETLDRANDSQFLEPDGEINFVAAISRADAQKPSRPSLGLHGILAEIFYEEVVGGLKTVFLQHRSYVPLDPIMKYLGDL